MTTRSRSARTIVLAAVLWTASLVGEPAEGQASARIQAAWVNDHVAGVVFGLETRPGVAAFRPSRRAAPA